MAVAEKNNPTGYKQDKTWQAAAKQVQSYNNAITQGKQGLKEFDQTYANMAGMATSKFNKLGQTEDGISKQNQQLETQRTALAALYSQNPAMMASHVMEQGMMQSKAEALATGPDGILNQNKLNELMYAYQQASLTGLDPGSMSGLDAITGGKGLESLGGLMSKTSGGMLNEILTAAQSFKGDSKILGDALLNANSGKEISNMRDKV